MTDVWNGMPLLEADDLLATVQAVGQAHPGSHKFAGGLKMKVRASSRDLTYAELGMRIVDPDEAAAGFLKSLSEACVARAMVRKSADAKGPAIWRSLSDARPFREAAVTLALQGAARADDRRVLALPEEWLLLDRQRLSAARAEQLSAEVGLHATSARWSQIETEDGARLVFHVLADPRRKSTFGSVLAGGGLEGMIACPAYDLGEGRRIFLPASACPSARSLDFLRFLFTAWAPVMEAPDVGVGAERLAVIYEEVEGVETVVRTRPLHALDFSDLRADDSRTTREARVQVLAGVPVAEARKQLQGWLAKHSPEHGYRLRLRPTRERHASEREIERLLERKMQVEDQLALLRNILPPRPTLLRYSQAQLPRLAEALRAYPIEALQGDGIHYACQGSSAPGDPAAGPQRWHFLLIDPQVARPAEINPAYRDRRDGEAAVSFWLDPFWARYYHGTGGGEVLLFVPEGAALFPTAHSWSPEEMDRYLREDVLGRFFHGRDSVQAIPPRPVYVFDSARTDPDQLEISVLSREDFQPVRQKLGWINSNLLLLHAYPELDEMIQQFADTQVRERHEAALARRRDAARAQFDEAAKAVAADFSEATRELTTEIEQALDGLHQQATATVAQLVQLTADLSALVSLQRKLTEDEVRAVELAAASSERMAKAIAEVTRLEKAAEAELAAIRQRNDKMNTEVRAVIEAQREKIEQLRRTLTGELF